MKVKSIRTIALILALLVHGSILRADQPTAPAAPPSPAPELTPPENYLGAGQFLATCEPNSVYSVLTSIQGLLNNQEFREAVKRRILEAARKGAGQSVPDWWVETGKFDLGGAGAIAWHSRLFAAEDAAKAAVVKPTPRDWLTAIAKTLESELRDHDDAQESLVRTRDTLRGEVDSLQRRLMQQRRKISDVKKVLGLSKEAAQRAQMELQTANAELQRDRAQFQSSQLQIQGLDARRQALENQIAELGEKVGEDAGRDPVVVELAKVVQARERLLASVRALHKAAAPGGGEDALANAEGGLAEARAELAKYQRVATQSAGGERLAELTKRLADTQIELAEAKARNELLKQQQNDAQMQLGLQSEELLKVKTDSAEVNQLETDIQIEETQYRKLSERLRDAELELKLHRPPTVTVIPQS